MPKHAPAAPEASRAAGAALLVIDVQRELFAKSAPIYRAESTLATIKDLIGRAHAAGAPVVYVQHSADRHLVYESDGWQLHACLRPEEGDLRIHKLHGNAFEETPLQAELSARGIERVVTCGLVTHGCVKATCLGALALNYGVTLAADGHSSYSQDAGKLIEEWNAKLSREGAQVTPGREIRFD